MRTSEGERTGFPPKRELLCQLWPSGFLAEEGRKLVVPVVIQGGGVWRDFVLAPCLWSLKNTELFIRLLSKLSLIKKKKKGGVNQGSSVPSPGGEEPCVRPRFAP